MEGGLGCPPSAYKGGFRNRQVNSPQDLILNLLVTIEESKLSLIGSLTSKKLLNQGPAPKQGQQTGGKPKKAVLLWEDQEERG